MNKKLSSRSVKSEIALDSLFLIPVYLSRIIENPVLSILVILVGTSLGSSVVLHMRSPKQLLTQGIAIDRDGRRAWRNAVLFPVGFAVLGLAQFFSATLEGASSMLTAVLGGLQALGLLTGVVGAIDWLIYLYACTKAESETGNLVSTGSVNAP